jgi:hypothetical protein
MKLINATLNDKQIKSSELSDDIQNEIKDLKEKIVKFNESVSEYNDSPKKSKVATKKLDAMQDDIEDLEKSIVEKIKGYEKPEPVVETTPAPAPKTEPIPNPTPTEKKGDSSLGWLIFGGVALVVTLGAVNLFKKRG